MSNFINQSTSQYNISSTGYNKQDFQNSIDKSKQNVKTNVEDNSATQAVSGMMGSPEELKKTFAIALPMYYADKYLIEKIYNGAGNKSILAKSAKVGDKVSTALHLNKIVSSENVSKLGERLRTNNFTKYFTNDYKAIAKSSLAHHESLSSRCVDSILSLFEKVKDNPELASKLYNGDALSDTAKKVFESIGALKGPVTKGYLETVQKVFSEDILPKLTDDAEIKTVQSFLKNVGEHIAKINAGSAPQTGEISSQIAGILNFVKDKHSDLLVGEGKTLLSSVVTDRVKPSIEETIRVAEEVSAKGIEKIPVKRELKSLSGHLNKLKASSMKMGDTLIGKFSSKLTYGTKDALTYGGGLVSFLFVVSTLKESIKAAKEAPKGEKMSAFAHEFANGYLGCLLFRPATNLCYSIGGNKYRGMTTEGREALKELVTKANTTPGLSKEAIKVANIQKKLLIDGVDKSKVAEIAGKSLEEAKTMAAALKGEGAKLKFWEKPLKSIGKILDVGLDSIKKTHVVKLPIFGEKMISFPTLKGFAGGFARFALIMFVIQPIIQKPVEKLVHKIFGEPTNYLKNKEAKEKKSSNNAQPSQNNSPVTQNNSQTQVSSNNQSSVIPQSSTNLIRMYTQAGNSETPLANSPISTNTDEIPALKLNKNKDNSKRYVPSIEVNFNDSSEEEKQLEKKVDEILKQTDPIIKNYHKNGFKK